MSGKVPIRALFLALLLLFPLTYADEIITKFAFQTKIGIQSVNGSTAVVRLTYVNLSYYVKPNMDATKNPNQIDPNRKTTTQQQDFTIEPLPNAEIYFYLDGKNVSEDGSNPSCAPSLTNESGHAECKINYYYNGSEWKGLNTRKSCGMAIAVFKGKSIGDKEFKPSTQEFLICPSGSSSLSAFGPVLIGALTSPSAIPFCFPAMLIVGLLISSMYYSGRDPLSLFDLTTPRLPKAKQLRISAGGTAMSIRTAVTRYLQAKKIAKKNVEKMLAKMARKSGKSGREAKKELRKLFKDIDAEISAVLTNEKMTEDDLKEIPKKYLSALLNLFNKYGFEDLEKKNKLYRMYFEKAQKDFEMFYTSEVAMRIMQTSRAPYGGRLYKWINKLQQKMTDKLTGFEKALTDHTPLSRLVYNLPLVGMVAVPHKILDAIAQYRSAKGWIRGTRRAAYGYMLSKILTKENEQGERENRAAGKLAQKFLDKTGISDFAKWMYGWDYNKYLQRHSLMAKKLGHIRNEEELYAWYVREAMGISPILLFASLEDREFSLVLEKMWNDKRKKEIYDKLYNEALQEIGSSNFNKTKTYRRIINSDLEKDEKKAIARLIQTMQIVSEYEKGAPMHQLLTSLVSLRGWKNDQQISNYIGEIKKVEEELYKKFGLMRLKQGEIEKLVFFSKRTLKEMADNALEKARQIDERIIKLRNQNKSPNEIANELKIPVNIVNDRIKWLDSAGKKLLSNISSSDAKIINAYKQSSSVKEFAAQLLLDELKNKLGKCDAVRDLINNQKRNPLFLFDLANDEKLFDEQIGNKLKQQRISELNKEIDKDGKIVENGILSRLQRNVSDLAVLLAKKAKTDDAMSQIVLGSDPAGSVVGHIYRKVAGVLGIDPAYEIKSINDFELLFGKGANRADFSRNITSAIDGKLHSGVSANQLALKLAEAIGITKDKNIDIFVRSFEAIAKNREQISSKLKAIHGTSDYEKICKYVNLKDQLALAKRGQMAYDALDLEILDRLHLLDKSKSPFKVRGAISILELKNKEQLSNTSYTKLLVESMLEKTENVLANWGAKILHSNDILSMKMPKPISYYKNMLANELALVQQLEYSASRKTSIFTQYYGESSQHLETLLYTSRALNRGIEFAISKNFGTNAAGSLLGAYSSEKETMLKSYAMQRAMYLNLIDGNPNSSFYDKKFAEEVAALKKKAGAKIEEFDAIAYSALQKRGMLFLDAKKGMPFIQTSDNRGIIPIFEYETDQLKNYPDNKPRSIIVKKDEWRDYSPLLARLRVSNFGSEIFNIVLAKNEGTLDNPKFVRVNPSEIPTFRTLSEGAKININRRADIAEIIAREGGLHAVSGPYYVDKHMKGIPKLYQNAVAKFGEFAYDIFYNDIIRLRSWYAAQARARQAIESQNALASKWTDDGRSRLQANKFFEEHQDDENMKKFKELLMDIENEKTKLLTEDEKKKRKSLLEVLKDTVSALERTDKSAEFYRRNAVRIDKESGSLESVEYGAKLSVDALKKMKDAGLITNDEFLRLKEAAKNVEKSFHQAYLKSKEEHKEFTRAVIEITGSHDNTYYGSSRSIFTLLIPEFKFRQAFSLGFGFSIESSAMRDSAYNRGGRRGAEYFEYMNMNTGQGIYENQRWWSASLYEQSAVPFLAPSLWVHTRLLPFAAHSYRKMVGLSSYLQRTELETEWGKPSFSPLSFFGLKRGTTDFFSSNAQMASDYIGLSVSMAALRKGGKVELTPEGEVDVSRSKFARLLDWFGVESSHTFSDTQLRWQNRLQDRFNAFLNEYGNEKIEKNGQTFKVVDVLKEYENTRRLLDVTYDEPGRKTLENQLKEYEEMLKPYIRVEEPSYLRHLPHFTISFVDNRPRFAITGEGVGHYFNIDGSRLRPMNIFIGEHVNTWIQVIPGMTERQPFIGKVLSTPTVNYFEHWPRNYRNIAQARNLAIISEGYQLKQDDAGFYLYASSYDTQRDAYRPVFRLETPALMQTMKMQSYAMSYDLFEPFIKTLVPERLRSHEDWEHSIDRNEINARLAAYGIGDGTNGLAILEQNIQFKYSGYAGYDPLAMKGPSSGWEKFFDKILIGKIYDNIYQRIVRNHEFLALQSEEHKRNLREFIRYMELMYDNY